MCSATEVGLRINCPSRRNKETFVLRCRLTLRQAGQSGRRATSLSLVATPVESGGRKTLPSAPNRIPKSGQRASRFRATHDSHGDPASCFESAWQSNTRDENEEHEHVADSRARSIHLQTPPTVLYAKRNLAIRISPHSAATL